jgi:hypothetical protein
MNESTTDLIKRWTINRSGWMEGCASGSLVMYDDHVKALEANAALIALLRASLRKVEDEVEGLRRDAEIPPGVLIDSYAIPSDKYDAIKVQRAQQIAGPDLWKATRAGGDCLSKSGTREWEPMPSSRDDAFMKRCRFDSAAQAIDAALASQKEQTC